MEKISIILPISKKTVEISLDRKIMKTCRLKVYPTQEIILSIPLTVPIAWAKEFLTDKSAWIESKLESFRRTSGYAVTDEIRNGFSIKMLGEDMLFVVTECNKEQVYSQGKHIYICCHDPDDQERVWKLFENWWRKQAKEIFQKRTEEWYPIVQNMGLKCQKLQFVK